MSSFKLSTELLKTLREVQSGATSVMGAFDYLSKLISQEFDERDAE